MKSFRPSGPNITAARGAWKRSWKPPITNLPLRLILATIFIYFSFAVVYFPEGMMTAQWAGAPIFALVLGR